MPFGSTGYSGVVVGHNGGTGILTLTGNSLLDATPTNLNNTSGNFVYNVIDIGLNTGSASAGTITVGGTSTLRANNGPFNNLGLIVVGDGGTGTLTIQNQGFVQTGSFLIGSRYQGDEPGASALCFSTAAR